MYLVDIAYRPYIAAMVLLAILPLLVYLPILSNLANRVFLPILPFLPNLAILAILSFQAFFVFQSISAFSPNLSISAFPGSSTHYHQRSQQHQLSRSGASTSTSYNRHVPVQYLQHAPRSRQKWRQQFAIDFIFQHEVNWVLCQHNIYKPLSGPTITRGPVRRRLLRPWGRLRLC